MSLQKAAMSARLAKLPRDLPTATVYPSEDYEEDDESEETDGLGDLSSSNPPSFSSLPRRKAANTVDLSPLSASGHFAQAVQVALPAADLDVRVYLTPPVPSETDKNNGENGSIMIFHHGAGYGALSFACVGKAITDATIGECGVLAFDARAHGRTTSLSNPGTDPVTLDLTLERLSSDFVELISTIFPNPQNAPSLILVGHSMGGAVVTRSSGELIKKGYNLVGISVLDVVEGTAIEALPHMHHLLESRPDGFPTQERAVEWHVTGQTGSTIRNIYSARISVPTLVVPSTPEDVEAGMPAWKWRTPLKLTSAYWQGWFTGLSKSFLEARTARLLILAGTERLDKELMIGQMTGKYQLVVISDVGHMLHEDDPNRVAQILIEFWRRNERLILPNIKKVGQA